MYESIMLHATGTLALHPTGSLNAHRVHRWLAGRLGASKMSDSTTCRDVPCRIPSMSKHLRRLTGLRYRCKAGGDSREAEVGVGGSYCSRHWTVAVLRNYGTKYIISLVNI